MATQNDATELLTLIYQKMGAPDASDHFHYMLLDLERANFFPTEDKTKSISEYVMEILQTQSGTL